MNEAIRETRECRYGKWVRTTWVKNHQCHFTTGSTAYTKPLFRLVKCTILALPWSLNECPDAVLDESFDGLKVWWCWSWSSSSSKGFEGWGTPKYVILAQWWLGVSSQVESEKELRETSAEIRGSLFEWKDRPKAWHKNVRFPEEF